MRPTRLELDELAVESFATADPEAAATLPTTMRTFERDCTYPDLCGDTTG
ncbi:hypothetical protein [Longimicrobium sp.]|nr:hypothetical protein [Longimicrobium sp.]HSU15927.1 hypothetical protein [Longimicrobium sp.]